MSRTDVPAHAGPRKAKHTSSGGRSRTPVHRAPGTHRCLVLACGVDDTSGIDLDSGALVRLRIGWTEAGAEADLSPFDLIDAAWADDPERDDLAQPEAVTVAGLPERVGTLRGRRARRFLRHLVAPDEPELLGFPGTSAPYWEFRGMRPSVALVVPRRGPVLFRRREDGTVWARFSAARSDNWLPVEDRRAMATLWASRRDRLSGKDLATALGFRPHYVLVAVSRPRDGHCYKTVVSILPRP
ncbi:MAG TPA: hypothetical protein VNC61_11160 [Acidimicrobiales bacterium]|nr:hypothetical protein [Acidimicrobiales bacterium]